jgi:stress-induced morphogen
MAINASSIRDKILGALVGAEISVSDTTGGGDHYAARIVHAGFEGKSLIDRHRLVYAALGDAMKADIHALALETLTPAEAQSRKPSASTVKLRT